MHSTGACRSHTPRRKTEAAPRGTSWWPSQMPQKGELCVDRSIELQQSAIYSECNRSDYPVRVIAPTFGSSFSWCKPRKVGRWSILLPG